MGKCALVTCIDIRLLSAFLRAGTEVDLLFEINHWIFYQSTERVGDGACGMLVVVGWGGLSQL